LALLSVALSATKLEDAGSVGRIGSIKIDQLPTNALNSFKEYEAHGWQGTVPGQAPGTRAGGRYYNYDGKLPTTDSFGNPIYYREFDVNAPVEGIGRDAQRFVVGSDGSVYFTDSHYGDIISPSGLPSFVKIE